MKFIWLMILLIVVQICIGEITDRQELTVDFHRKMFECNTDKCKYTVRREFMKEYHKLKLTSRMNVLKEKFRRCAVVSSFKLCYQKFKENEKNLISKFNQRLKNSC
eukprot:gene10390-2919_t